jgi:hypothetical protein
MPLSHVTPTAGLSDAAAAGHRIAATVEELKTAVEYVPDNARWQTDLLVLELEESKSVKTALQAMQDIGEGTARIAATAETLPATLTADVSKLIDDIGEKQTALQDTLEKAHAAASEAHATVESMDATLGRLDEVVKSTDPSAQSLARMGDSLTVAFEKFTVLMEVLTKPSPDPTPAAEKGPPFDINDYGRTADKITATAKELAAVLDKLEALTASDRVASLSGAADQTVQSTLDYLFVGIGILLLFGFLLALGYRYLTR